MDKFYGSRCLKGLGGPGTGNLQKNPLQPGGPKGVPADIQES